MLQPLVSHRAGPHRSGGVVSGAGGHPDGLGQTQGLGHLRQEGPHCLVALVQAGHLSLRKSTQRQHVPGPAFVCHVQKEHPGSVGIVGAVYPGQEVD